MLNDVITIQKGVLTPIFVSTNKEIDEKDLNLFIYRDGEFVKEEVSFKKAGDKLYKTDINFDKGYYQVRIKYKDNIIDECLIHATDTIDKLIEIEMGNWEIKNNQMIFKDRENNEIMRFDLFDEYNNPSMLNVFKRVRV